jgi:uncharacterized SAM-binding protein YcdF (DUF218 family)
MSLVLELMEFLLLPSNFIGAATAFGLLALVRWRRLGTAVLSVAGLILLVAGWSPLGPFALTILEGRFPQPRLSEPVAGIIMLGGGVDTHVTADRSQVALNEAGERVTTIASLSRQFPDARLLLSGGANHVLTTQPLSESAVARDLLIDLGVSADRIEMEERSRDTCENAIESRALAKPVPSEQWLLITSASHMARAVACFRAVGFEVVPVPVDFRTRGAADISRPTASISVGLQASDLAAHEWLGLLSYRLSGRTSGIFPAP